MPTKPFEKLLYREMRKVEATEIIKIASPLLQEEVNYATNAFERCQVAAGKLEPDEPVPVLNAYHQIIGIVDSIEVLLSQSCPIPSIPLLRVAYEGLLTLGYILKEDSRRRAFAWLVCYFHDRIKRYKMFDSNRQQGKEFIAALKDEELDQFFDLPPYQDVDHAILNLESLLKKKNYKEVEEEFTKTQKIKRRFNWYSLYDGPNNLLELARYLKRLASYSMLYRQWSSFVHCGDLSYFLQPTDDNSPALNVIRNPKEIQLVCTFASTFIIDATRLMLQKYRAGEMKSFTNWYLTEVQNRYLSLAKK